MPYTGFMIYLVMRHFQTLFLPNSKHNLCKVLLLNCSVTGNHIQVPLGSKIHVIRYEAMLKLNQMCHIPLLT